MGSNNSNSEALLQLPVESNMKVDPPTTSRRAPISDVVDVMMEEDVGAVIVVEDDLPVGIITALVGAPFFIYLLRRSKREYGF